MLDDDEDNFDECIWLDQYTLSNQINIWQEITATENKKSSMIYRWVISHLLGQGSQSLFGSILIQCFMWRGIMMMMITVGVH